MKLAATCAIALAASCHHLPVTTSRNYQPVAQLVTTTDKNTRGRLLAASDGAEGRDIVELPSGDLLVAGKSQSEFVERVTADGSRTWIVPVASCGPVHIAAVDDNGFYASFAACPPTTPAELSIVRFDGSGQVVWRTGEAGAKPGLAPPAATRDLVAAAARDVVIAVAPTGTVAWRVDFAREAGDATDATIVRALWIEGARVIALVSRPHDCALRALDAATGAPAWTLALPVDKPGSSCDRDHVAIAAAGGVFATEVQDVAQRWGWRLTQFDPATGVVGWRRWLDARSADGPALRTAALADVRVVLRLLLAIADDTYSSYVFVGVDPANGRMLRFAEPALTGEIVNPSYFEVNGYALGRGGLLATGAFYGHLRWDGLDAATASHRETICADEDVGFSHACLRHDVRAENVALFFARIRPGS